MVVESPISFFGFFFVLHLFIHAIIIFFYVGKQINVKKQAL